MEDLKRAMQVYYDRRAPEYDEWYACRGVYQRRDLKELLLRDSLFLAGFVS